MQEEYILFSHCVHSYLTIGLLQYFEPMVFIEMLKVCVVFSERGVVWEETIILLPDNVHYVFLSATIPNARQFAEWICHLHKQVNNIIRSSIIVR